MKNIFHICYVTLEPYLGGIVSLPTLAGEERFAPNPYLAPKPEVVENSNFACG